MLAILILILIGYSQVIVGFGWGSGSGDSEPSTNCGGECVLRAYDATLGNFGCGMCNKLYFEFAKKACCDGLNYLSDNACRWYD